MICFRCGNEMSNTTNGKYLCPICSYHVTTRFYEDYLEERLIDAVVTKDDVISQVITNPIINRNFHSCVLMKRCSITKVIFNNPATIVIWDDGTKTVVKCGKNDIYDPEKGLAMAIAKRYLGDKGNYYNEFKKWLPEEKSETSLFTLLANSIYGNSYKYIQKNKYGETYDTRLFYAGNKHNIVCAGDCYHVKNIKKENLLVYFSLDDAIKDGCRPCKHCHGVHKENE